MKTSYAALRKGSNGATVIETSEGTEISLYDGTEASPQEIVVAMSRLKAAFPRQRPEFFNILSERVIANGFSSKRLEDAVNKAIDNFQYKELNISDIIRFDRRQKLYTYAELQLMVDRGHSCDDFEMLEINGRKYWAEIKPQ